LAERVLVSRRSLIINRSQGREVREGREEEGERGGEERGRRKEGGEETHPRSQLNLSRERAGSEEPHTSDRRSAREQHAMRTKRHIEKPPRPGSNPSGQRSRCPAGRGLGQSELKPVSVYCSLKAMVGQETTAHHTTGQKLDMRKARAQLCARAKQFM